MVYLKPRQDLNTLAPPLSVATPLSCSVLIFCQKRSHKKVTKAPDAFGGQRAAFPVYFPILPASSALVCHYPASHCHLVTATHDAIKWLLSTQKNTGLCHKLYH